MRLYFKNYDAILFSNSWPGLVINSNGVKIYIYTYFVLTFVYVLHIEPYTLLSTYINVLSLNTTTPSCFRIPGRGPVPTAAPYPSPLRQRRRGGLDVSTLTIYTDDILGLPGAFPSRQNTRRTSRMPLKCAKLDAILKCHLSLTQRRHLVFGSAWRFSV